MQNNLKVLREASGLKQNELAEKIGISPSQVNGWEKGTRRLSDHWINKLAIALKCSPADLLASTLPGKSGARAGTGKLHPTDDVRVYERVVAAMHELQEMGLKIRSPKMASAIFSTVAKYVQSELDAGRDPSEEAVHGRITAEVKKLQAKAKPE